MVHFRRRVWSRFRFYTTTSNSQVARLSNGKCCKAWLFWKPCDSSLFDVFSHAAVSLPLLLRSLLVRLVSSSRFRCPFILFVKCIIWIVIASILFVCWLLRGRCRLLRLSPLLCWHCRVHCRFCSSQCSVAHAVITCGFQERKCGSAGKDYIRPRHCWHTFIHCKMQRRADPRDWQGDCKIHAMKRSERAGVVVGAKRLSDTECGWVWYLGQALGAWSRHSFEGARGTGACLFRSRPRSRNGR